MRKTLLAFLLSTATSFAQTAPTPYGVLPSKRQLAWHDVEVYGLVHFTPTTFENKEWGYGDADPKQFNPSDFNAEQIVKSAKAGGLKGLILVAKHHDGFALWPTKTTDYNISKSPFRNGKGDVVKEFEQAARKHGLKFGIYCSPWDRNHAKYGTPEYLKIYQTQLQELYTNYGSLFMSWHDGANGGDGYYGGANEKRSIDNTTYYQWDQTWGEITRKLQPNANIFSDIGWDVRWAGNEDGSVNETSWATITPEPAKGQNKAVPGQALYEINPSGTRNGKYWMPAECDVPLRQGWFYHAKENPKSVEKLMDLYFKSVGRGAGLDLGLAPDTRGQLHDDDVKILKDFGTKLSHTFSNNFVKTASLKSSNSRGKSFGSNELKDGNIQTYWATNDHTKEATLELNWKNKITFDIVSLQEFIALGQRIANFEVSAFINGQWKSLYKGESVGHKRLIKLATPVTAEKIRVNLKAPVAITLSEIGVYKMAD